MFTEETLKIIAICLFALTYILLLVFANYRHYIAAGSAVIFLILGILPIDKLLVTINWNVLLMLAGTMGLVSLFIESRMPALLGDIIISKMPNVRWAIVALAFFAGLISAFVDNVATVIMVAPIFLAIAKKLKISPVEGIIAIAISANIQGAATLVGDTTSIMLGGELGMTFFDFFVYKGHAGLFWVIEAAAIIATLYLFFVFRKKKEPINIVDKETVTDYFPTVLMIGVIVLLIIASLIPAVREFELTNGLICFGLFVIGLIRSMIKKKSFKSAFATLKDIDFVTLLLLAGLFVVIGGITQVGVITDLANFLAGISNNIFVIYTIIVFASVILSAFIDNIPYVATMLPVVGGIAALLNIEPFVLYFGLMIGATLGGNLTPIGASANIAGLGFFKKEGYNVKAKDFMKLSIPFTMIAVVVGYVLIWLIWA